MLASWGNFFFGSFDPAGIVTVDKPPVAIWIQAASAKLFGFNGISVLAPQALMGVASVILTYYLVRRVFGAGAGLLAGLALAITPISVAVDRDNLPDSALVLVLLLATWALSRAAETGQLKWLLTAMALVGLGFNVKMLAAFVVLPTFYLAYFLAAPGSRWTRIGNLACATVVLVATSLSWATIVELTPTDKRPYIGGSKNNSASNWRWATTVWLGSWECPILVPREHCLTLPQAPIPRRHRRAARPRRMPIRRKRVRRRRIETRQVPRANFPATT